MTSSRTPKTGNSGQTGARPETSPRNGVGRRAWMKQAAGVIGGAAVTGVTAPVPPVEAAAATTTGTHVETTSRDVVETTSGRVRGFSRNGVHIFRGMPLWRDDRGRRTLHAAKESRGLDGRAVVHVVGTGLAACAADRLGQRRGTVPLPMGRRVRW